MIELFFFQMIGFYSSLAGNRARTEVLPLLITRAQPISDISIDQLLYFGRYQGQAGISYGLFTADKI